MMKLMEEDVVEELNELRELAKRLHASQAFPDLDAEAHGWVSMYRHWIEEKLQKEVLVGQKKAAQYQTKPNSHQLAVLHATRRTVAILHEESHLISQGIDVPGIAAEYGETIAGGCRSASTIQFICFLTDPYFSVNTVVFRRLYGFW